MSSSLEAQPTIPTDDRPMAAAISGAQVAGTLGPSVIESLEALEKHRLECVATGQYEEADLTKARIQQMKAQEEARLCEELRSQQLAALLGVEEAHMKELQEFNEIWDKKVVEYEEHAAKLEGTLSERQQTEHAQYLQKLAKEVEPRTPRWSRDLLNLRKIEATLAKQKKYSEAAGTKAEADQMEAQEQQLWKSRRDTKIASLAEQFTEKQRLEMKGLLKRVESGREEQKQARTNEMERLLLRYHNVKTQLQSQQKIIAQHVEKNPLANYPGLVSTPLPPQTPVDGS